MAISELVVAIDGIPGPPAHRPMADDANHQLEKEGVMEIIIIIIAFGLILNAVANLWLEGQR